MNWPRYGNALDLTVLIGRSGIKRVLKRYSRPTNRMSVPRGGAQARAADGDSRSDAVKNNVRHLNVATCAGIVSRFVLTDRQGEPTMMGSTKRIAEMVVLEMHHRYPDTTFAAVRFAMCSAVRLRYSFV